MLKDTAEEYSKYLKTDLDKKLIPIHQSVDDMLTRLEEFETLLTIVQQERCNSVGITGCLSQATDSFGELKQLCSRIDVIEKLMQHVRSNVDAVERKVEAAEEQCGLTDNAMKIKNLLIPLFKKNVTVKEHAADKEMEIFSTEAYFCKESNDEEKEDV